MRPLSSSRLLAAPTLQLAASCAIKPILQASQPYALRDPFRWSPYILVQLFSFGTRIMASQATGMGGRGIQLATAPVVIMQNDSRRA